MKRLILLFAFLPGILFAQEEGSTETSLKNKNGVELLPQAGDWGLSISASTSLQFIGNIFSNTVNNNTNWWENPDSPVTVIRGKYFVSPDFAFRGGVRLNYSSSKSFFTVNDDNGNGPDDYLEDKASQNAGGITLLAGVEKRKGTTRIQGVYGGELFVGFNQTTKSSYEYANQMTQANQNPTSTGFGAPAGVPFPANGYRILEAKNGTDLVFGVRAFIGVEVFLFPKMSLGGNFIWDVRYDGSTSRSTTWEGWDAQAGEAAEYTLSSTKGKQFSADISNAGGDISVNFYF